LDTENLKAVTSAPNEPALHYSEQQKLISGKSALQRLKGAGGLAASALLATSLLLGACGDDDDCIVTTPPTNAPVNLVLPPITTPNDSSSTPSTPSSSQFTSGSSTGTAQTYCKSRRTGAFYWYSGTRYYSSSGS
jgi:hypothetical protein